jgi:hypothetical protein
MLDNRLHRQLTPQRKAAWAAQVFTLPQADHHARRTAHPKTFKAAGAKGIHLIVPLKATQKLFCHVDSILGELLANDLRP